MAEETKTQEMKGITRIGDKDVKGDVRISHALTLTKGSSFMFANAVCSVLKLDRSKKAGLLTDEEAKKIEDCLRNPLKYGIPVWLLNRRQEPETGEDKHLISSELELTKKFDIRRMKKARTYKGIRHTIGSKKVRGQRTKSTGRKGKTLGVQRKKTSGKKG